MGSPENHMKSTIDHHEYSSDSHQCRQKRYHSDDIVYDIIDTLFCWDIARSWKYLIHFKCKQCFIDVSGKTLTIGNT